MNSADFVLHHIRLICPYCVANIDVPAHNRELPSENRRHHGASAPRHAAASLLGREVVCPACSKESHVVVLRDINITPITLAKQNNR